MIVVDTCECVFSTTIVSTVEISSGPSSSAVDSLSEELVDSSSAGLTGMLTSGLSFSSGTWSGSVSLSVVDSLSEDVVDLSSASSTTISFSSGLFSFSGETSEIRNDFSSEVCRF